MKFGYIYAMPGYSEQPYLISSTDKATFIAAQINSATKDDAIKVAKNLYETYHVDSIELCGALANDALISQIKTLVQNKIPVGAISFSAEDLKVYEKLLS